MRLKLPSIAFVTDNADNNYISPYMRHYNNARHNPCSTISWIMMSLMIMMSLITYLSLQFGAFRKIPYILSHLTEPSEKFVYADGADPCFDEDYGNCCPYVSGYQHMSEKAICTLHEGVIYSPPYGMFGNGLFCLDDSCNRPLLAVSAAQWLCSAAFSRLGTDDNYLLLDTSDTQCIQFCKENNLSLSYSEYPQPKRIDCFDDESCEHPKLANTTTLVRHNFTESDCGKAISAQCEMDQKDLMWAILPVALYFIYTLIATRYHYNQAIKILKNKKGNVVLSALNGNAINISIPRITTKSDLIRVVRQYGFYTAVIENITREGPWIKFSDSDVRIPCIYPSNCKESMMTFFYQLFYGKRKEAPKEPPINTGTNYAKSTLSV